MPKVFSFARQTVVAGFLACFLLFPGVLFAAENAKTTDKIKDMLQERLNIARKIQTIIKLQYEKGLVSCDVLHDTEAALLRAKLDLCETKAKEERIKVYEDMVKEAEGWYLFAKNKYDAGYKQSEVELLKTKDFLIECQIGLERVKNALDNAK